MRSVQWIRALCAGLAAWGCCAATSLAQPAGVPQGACCIDTNAQGTICVIRTEAACRSENGTWLGTDFVCTMGSCQPTTPPPIGACCTNPNSPIGTPINCSVTTQAQCQSTGGTWKGANTACSATLCPQPSGACCLSTTTGTQTCVIRSQPACTADGGQWRGPNTACTNNICVPATPTGACCVTSPNAGSQVCQIKTEAQCAQLQGQWHGQNTACTSTTCPPRGACCFEGFAGPVCQIMTAAQCANTVGGQWRGANTTCSNDTCSPRGACCLPATPGAASVCSIRTQAQCANANGQWKGPNTTCSTQTCVPPAPVGACCAGPNTPTDAVCLIRTRVECDRTGGRWLGANTVCTTDNCLPRGACCVQVATGGRTCIVMTPTECQSSGGTFLGANITCTPTSCIPTGACCIDPIFTPNGPVVPGNRAPCIVRTEAQCVASGGRFLGVNVPCSAAACATVGACCFEGFAGPICQVMTAAECATTVGGQWRGPNTVCADDTCVRRGACCVSVTTQPTGPGTPDAPAVCTLKTAEECKVAGGRFLGDNVPCSNTACDPVGACCVTNNSHGTFCTQFTSAQCAYYHGQWQGANTPCRPLTCPNECPCDWNGNGFVTVEDLFEFIDDYNTGTADFNEDGVTNVQDILDFIQCFQTIQPACRGLPGPF